MICLNNTSNTTKPLASAYLNGDVVYVCRNSFIYTRIYVVRYLMLKWARHSRTAGVSAGLATGF